MRTTLDIPKNILDEAMKASHVKTKTMAVILGLKELIHAAHTERLRALRGNLSLHVDLKRSRAR